MINWKRIFLPWAVLAQVERESAELKKKLSAAEHKVETNNFVSVAGPLERRLCESVMKHTMRRLEEWAFRTFSEEAFMIVQEYMRSSPGGRNAPLRNVGAFSVAYSPSQSLVRIRAELPSRVFEFDSLANPF